MSSAEAVGQVYDGRCTPMHSASQVTVIPA